jgi:hypothetical protein
MIYYAKSTGWFYDSAKSQSLPADAVEVSDEQHSALMAALAVGQVITADASGHPIAVSVPSPVMPNVAGFVTAIKTALGGIVPVNAFMRQYPTYYDALTQGLWADVEALTADAKATGILTAAQYSQFQAAFTANDIPVTLP